MANSVSLGRRAEERAGLWSMEAEPAFHRGLARLQAALGPAALQHDRRQECILVWKKLREG